MELAVVMRRDLVAELLRGPMALAAAGTLTNGFNLVMNLVLARALDPAGYGAVGVQTSIFMILSVVGNSVLTATVHRESAEIGDTRRERRIWIRQLRNVTLVAVLVASLLSLALCEPVSLLLSYPHPLAIAEAAIAAAIWVGLCIERGLLQARGNYPALARNLVYESAFRITCIVILVSAGLGVNGAGIGLAAGVLFGSEHARLAVARTPSLIRRSPSARARLRGGDDVVTPTPTVTGPIPMMPAAATPRRTRDSLIAEASVALATLVPLALMQNMDIVIVGWRNPDGVGSYAAISTACKVPVFIGLAVANFLLPEAARRRKEGLGAGRALTMALVCVVTPGLFLAAVGAVAGHLILSLVFGPKLAGAAPDLWVLALAMTYLAASLMFATYLLGAGYRKIVWALACCTPVTAVVLTLANGDIGRTAAAGLACQAFTAAVAGALVYRLHHKHFAATDDDTPEEKSRQAPEELAVAADSGAYTKTIARRRPLTGSGVVFAELVPSDGPRVPTPAGEGPRPAPAGSAPPAATASAPRATSAPKPSSPKPSSPKPSAPKPSAPKPSAPKPSAPKPSEPSEPSEASERTEPSEPSEPSKAPGPRAASRLTPTGEAPASTSQ